MILKLAHISDVHLGAKLMYLGKKGDEHREDIKNSFRKTVDTAIEQKVDLFMAAGDLFDSPFPSRNNQIFAIEQFKRLIAGGIHVLVISGNHDRSEAGSVYISQGLTEIQSKEFKIVAGSAQSEWIIENLGLRIIAAGTEKQKSNVTPYKSLKADKKYQFNVGVFHGSVDIKGMPANNPIFLKDIQSSGLDYLALGDWHNSLQVSQNPVCWYSGSPELVDSDQEGAGNMLIVKLETGKAASVEKIPIGSKHVENLKVDLSKFENYGKLSEFLKKSGDKNCILNLELGGFRKIDELFPVEELKTALSENYYFVNIKDSSKLEADKDSLSEYPENMLIGKFIKLMNAKRKAGDADLDSVIDDAIQQGVDLLKGGKL